MFVLVFVCSLSTFFIIIVKLYSIDTKLVLENDTSSTFCLGYKTTQLQTWNSVYFEHMCMVGPNENALHVRGFSYIISYPLTYVSCWCCCCCGCKTYLTILFEIVTLNWTGWDICSFDTRLFIRFSFVCFFFLFLFFFAFNDLSKGNCKRNRLRISMKSFGFE